MKKNPFKKQSIIDTLTNVGIGGAANVAIDYAVEKVDALSSLEDTTVNAIKIAAGALAGSMVSNKLIRAAADGVAVVGVSNLVKGLIASDAASEAASGLPYGTIGRVRPVRMGARYAKHAKVSGLQGVMCE